MHVAATLMSYERDRTIKASFFYDPEQCLNNPMHNVGDKVRLIGARLQMWRGCLQLSGKNVKFGQSLMSLSLRDAIVAWGVVTQAGAERYFPKLAITVLVKIWESAKTTKGAHIRAAMETKLL